MVRESSTSWKSARPRCGPPDQSHPARGRRSRTVDAAVGGEGGLAAFRRRAPEFGQPTFRKAALIPLGPCAETSDRPQSSILKESSVPKYEKGARSRGLPRISIHRPYTFLTLIRRNRYGKFTTPRTNFPGIETTFDSDGAADCARVARGMCSARAAQPETCAVAWISISGKRRGASAAATRRDR